MDRHSHILVIGAAGLDTKGYYAGPVRAGSSNPGTIRVSNGGCARNVAENLARLGETAVLLSAVGKGRSGRRVYEQTADAGVDVSYVIESAEHHTAAYVAIYDQDARLMLSVDDMGIMDLITPAVIYASRGLFRRAAHVFVDANLSPPSLKTVLRECAKRGIPVSADPTSVPLASRLKPHLSELNMITPDIPEAEVLCGRHLRNTRGQGIAAAKQLVAMGVRIAIVTLAELGVCYATSEVSGHIPAVKTQVVNRTGAGDALTAGVVFGLNNGFPVDEAVRLGAAAAALTLQQNDSVCQTLSLDCLYDALSL
jgi:pseudouridine kinase